MKAIQTSDRYDVSRFKPTTKIEQGLFDRARIGYQQPRYRETSGNVTIKGMPKGCGLAHWTGPFGGPTTNGEDDFLSDTEREARRKARGQKTCAEMERETFLSIRRKDLQAHVADGPRLRKPFAHAYRTLKGHVVSEGTLTRTETLASAIVWYRKAE